MKWLGICIINKRRFYKRLTAAAAATMAAGAALGLCIAAYHGMPEAAPAFSPQDVIKEGLPHEDEPFDIKGIVNTLLGFDTDKPETIIEQSSGLFASPEPTEPPPVPTAEPSLPPPPPAPGELPQLPGHDAIIAAHGLKMNNATGYSVDIDALAAQPSEIKPELSDAPEVLIMHTHTTECYIGDEMSGESERTTNENYNVCAVADVLAGAIEAYGIHTVHDKTIHDYPSYQGSYTRALTTITEDIKKYPSVKVVIDLHRDAYVYPDGTKLRVAANVNGRETAQAMLVLGTDSMGLYHPYWRTNLSLAAKIQSAAEIMYPGMMRPINLRRERFNMHVTKGSILIEVGSNGNTLAEAKAAAENLGAAIAAAMLNG